jgi:branched-subunit amino acid transport protein
MEGALKLWLVILAVGALNYLSRLSFIAAFGRRPMPAWLVRPLKFVPVAMLTALIVPMIVGAPMLGSAAWEQPKVAAAAMAAVVAYVTRSTPKTLAAGMVTLWLAQWLMGTK